VRRSAASVIAILVLALPPSTCAESWNLHAGAGLAFPVGSAALQEGLGTGWSATLGVGYEATPSLAVLVRASYSDFPRDDEGTLLVAALDQQPHRVLEITGGTMTSWDVAGEIRFSLSPEAPTVHPYLLGAAGLVSYEYERVDIAYAYAGHTWPATIPGERDTAACLSAGGGVRFETRPWLEFVVDTRLHITLRGDGALWSVPLWLTIAVSP